MNRRYRKTVIAANWKMNLLPGDCRDFIAALREKSIEARWCETVLCVPFTHIPAAVRAAKGAHIAIAAQNCHFEDSGAYTGEISCPMLIDAGVKYVVIGHSERRQYFGETDETVNKKTLAALSHGLRPIVCIGESLEIRDSGAELDFVRVQLKAALRGVTAEQLRRTVIAYEPVWAIGTGRVATPEQADRVCRALREALRSVYGARAARAASIIYGGSMNENNAASLLAMPDVDGGLVGGASLKAGSFSAIIDAANQ